MGEGHGTLADLQVDVGIVHRVFPRVAATDLKDGRVALTSVLQMVAVLITSSKPGTVSGTEHFLTIIAHQNNLAVQYEYELIFGLVPMPLARPLPRRQP